MVVKPVININCPFIGKCHLDCIVCWSENSCLHGEIDYKAISLMEEYNEKEDDYHDNGIGRGE